MYLHCDKKYFKYKNLRFHNGKFIYRSKQDYLYQLATQVPIDRAVIRDDSGYIINQPTFKEVLKGYVKDNDLEGQIDLRQSGQDILEQINKPKESKNEYNL